MSAAVDLKLVNSIVSNHEETKKYYTPSCDTIKFPIHAAVDRELECSTAHDDHSTPFKKEATYIIPFSEHDFCELADYGIQQHIASRKVSQGWRVLFFRSPHHAPEIRTRRQSQSVG